MWDSEAWLGTTEHMLGEGTNGKHLEVTLTGRVCALPQQKPQSLSIERQRKLAERFHPILAFLCLELRAHKSHSDMAMFLRSNFVKQCYFCWQNSRCSLGFVLFHLLQFLIYFTQMLGINKEKKIVSFAEMSCLSEER